MIYKILCGSTTLEASDKFETKLQIDPKVVANHLKALYEGAGIEVMGVVQMSEFEIDIH